MATVEQIRDALVTTIRSNITGVQVYARFEDVIEAPAIVVSVNPKESADFTGAFARGLDQWNFELHVFANRREGGYAQKELDQFLTGSGSKSIRQVLYQNPTIGLSETDAFVEGVKNYGGENPYAKIPHVGATVNVCVRTSGT